MKFDIPSMYKFHKQKSVDVEVDLIRVFWDDDKKNSRVIDDKYDKREVRYEQMINAGCGNGTESDDCAHEEEDESEGEEMPLGLCGHA